MSVTTVAAVFLSSSIDVLVFSKTFAKVVRLFSQTASAHSLIFSASPALLLWGDKSWAYPPAHHITNTYIASSFTTTFAKQRYCTWFFSYLLQVQSHLFGQSPWKYLPRSKIRKIYRMHIPANLQLLLTICLFLSPVLYRWKRIHTFLVKRWGFQHFQWSSIKTLVNIGKCTSKGKELFFEWMFLENRITLKKLFSNLLNQKITSAFWSSFVAKHVRYAR